MKENKPRKCVLPDCNRLASPKSKAGLCKHHLLLVDVETAYLAELDKKTGLVWIRDDA